MTEENLKDPHQAPEAHDDEQAIGWLGEAVASSWESAVESADDPFEIYIHKCHVKISHDHHSFCGRLRRGYRALLDTLRL